MSMIIRAAQFAAKAHRGQKRKYTGAPYITHPARVAGRMACHHLATEAIVAAAFLHDVVEDCNVPIGRIASDFGDDVECYVDWLTNPAKGSDKPRAERKQWDREHAAKAPCEVRVVKLLDRIDNLREIDPADKFTTLYCKESALLAEALRTTDALLYGELIDLIESLLGPAVELRNPSQ
jgi:(p)ppGpp synthase/HD superfamily hydrolase